MTISRFVLAALLATSASAVCADVLITKDGRHFQGSVTDAGTSYLVTMDMGTVSFSKDEVREVTTTPKVAKPHNGLTTEPARQLKSNAPTTPTGPARPSPDDLIRMMHFDIQLETVREGVDPPKNLLVQDPPPSRVKMPFTPPTGVRTQITSFACHANGTITSSQYGAHLLYPCGSCIKHADIPANAKYSFHASFAYSSLPVPELVSSSKKALRLPVLVQLDLSPSKARYLVQLLQPEGHNGVTVDQVQRLSLRALPPRPRQPSVPTLGAPHERWQAYREDLHKYTYWLEMLGLCQDDAAIATLLSIAGQPVQPRSMGETNAIAWRSLELLTGYGGRSQAWLDDYAKWKLRFSPQGWERLQGSWHLPRPLSFSPPANLKDFITQADNLAGKPSIPRRPPKAADSSPLQIVSARYTQFPRSLESAARGGMSDTLTILRNTPTDHVLSLILKEDTAVGWDLSCIQVQVTYPEWGIGPSNPNMAGVLIRADSARDVRQRLIPAVYDREKGAIGVQYSSMTAIELGRIRVELFEPGASGVSLSQAVNIMSEKLGKARRE